MSQIVHVCSFRQEKVSGFTKLAPNASWLRRLLRNVRHFVALDPSNPKCKLFFRNKTLLRSEQRRYIENSYLFIIHPFSKLCTFLEITFSVAWLYSILLVPVTFEVSYFIIYLKILLILCFFVLGYVDKKTNEIVLAPKKIIWHYLNTYFLFDVIASRVIDITSFGNMDYLQKFEHIFPGYPLFTVVLCMISHYPRVGTILRNFNTVGHYFKLSTRVRFTIGYISKTFLILHLFACLLYFIPQIIYADDFPPESWISQANINPLQKKDDGFAYFECILMIICHFFGASRSAYDISLPVDEVCLSVVTLYGRLYTLFLLADVFGMFGIASVSRSRYEQRLRQLGEYMSTKDLPLPLRNRLLKFYEYKLQKQYFNESEILSTLSESLRTELFLFTARKLVKRAKVFGQIPKPTLGTIIASMTLETYSSNDTIADIGAVIEDVYFISSGTVSVSNKDGLELCHLEDGDEFGVTTCLTNNIQRYKHVALETTELFYINKYIFFQLIQVHPEAVRCFEATVKNRLARYQAIEEKIKQGGDSLLSELQRGIILEQKINKQYFED